MTGMDDRQAAFENKFAHDEELRFKTDMRRNKLLALWAAELIGLNEAQSAAYVGEVVKSDLEEVGSEDVYRKLKGDFEAKGIDITEHKLRAMMDEKLIEAKKQVMTEV